MLRRWKQETRKNSLLIYPMDYSIPKTKLTPDHKKFLDIFARGCRRTILEMVKTSQSGHPGGSLSSLDFLAVLYAFRLTQFSGTSAEKIVVSNGHISPAVYAVLAESGVADRGEVINTFRQRGSKFEGHVTRHVPGIYFGTGPLGVGVSAAAGFAKYEKMQNSGKKVWGVFGDGEAQEGQVHEMALFAAKEKLNNLVLFCDYNRVQLTDSLAKILPVDVSAIFKSYGWNVVDIDGHDHDQLWDAINKGILASDRPTIIVGQTIMGYGVPMMEEDGKNNKATWHGKTPKPEEIDQQLALPELALPEEAQKILHNFRTDRNFQPPKPKFTEEGKILESVNTGTPILYNPEILTDCRSAYGKALLDLAKNNKNVIAGSADLGGSVMTKFVASELPEQYIEFGICEQNMVSIAGALSLSGTVPFVSTFGAFMSSRAKDQARVNDINQTNVKMVSTHCGLSVGEDGPTHQAIDDMGSFLGMFHTRVIEPADPNQCDRIIRYVASRYGNYYIRMGRHKLPVLTREDGSVFYDADYVYEYGRTDVIRSGTSGVLLIASGPLVHEALAATENSGISATIASVTSPKKFDENLAEQLKSHDQILVLEDHNKRSGFGAAITLFAAENEVLLKNFKSIAVAKYELSGKPAELYENAGIGRESLEKVLKGL
jgi:transketolase